jgi:hypothetical protein
VAASSLTLVATTPPAVRLALKVAFDEEIRERQALAVDKKEARSIALTKVAELREMSWTELRACYLKDSETVGMAGASGTTYQVKTHAVWDSGKGGRFARFRGGR